MVSKCIKRVSGSEKRQCGRTLGLLPRAEALPAHADDGRHGWRLRPRLQRQLPLAGLHRSGTAPEALILRTAWKTSDRRRV
jgi:hypothetical protein